MGGQEENPLKIKGSDYQQSLVAREAAGFLIWGTKRKIAKQAEKPKGIYRKVSNRIREGGWKDAEGKGKRTANGI